MAKPWHLLSSDKRSRVIDVLGAKGIWIYPEAYLVAAQLLREAAPYPDEALVFATGECALDPVVQLVDIGWTDDYGKHHPESLMCEDDEGTEAPYHPSELRPLTIAAHEALEMLGGGE